MTIEKIESAVESYINGNVTATKRALKKMSKADVLQFVSILADHATGSIEKTQALLEG